MLIAASLVGFLLIGIFLFFWVKSIWGGKVAAVTIEQNSLGSVVPNGVVASLPTSLDEHVALDRMSRALATRQVGKVVDYFKLGETTRPDEVIAFLEGMQTRDGNASDSG